MVFANYRYGIWFNMEYNYMIINILHIMISHNKQSANIQEKSNVQTEKNTSLPVLVNWF